MPKSDSMNPFFADDYRETCHRVACVLLAMDQDDSGDGTSDDVLYGRHLVTAACVNALEATAGNEERVRHDY